jgi:hypothetical protein
MVELELLKVLPPTASVRIEVISHDEIHDVLAFIELREEMSHADLRALSKQVRGRFVDLRIQNPDDLCLASWSATFEQHGTRLATVSVLDRDNGQ